MSEDSKTIKLLKELCSYIPQLVKQKPIFDIVEHKNLCIWEHELKGKIGIQHDILDDNGVAIWLKIERLKREDKPPIPESIKEWIAVGNDPINYPKTKDKLTKTLTEKEVQKLLSERVILEDDIKEPLKEQISPIKMKDVILRLKNNKQVEAEIKKYIFDKWLPWSDAEKPRRETIKIYEDLFNLQQTIGAQSDEKQIELIWGIGISRWKYDEHKINYPLLEQQIEIEIDDKDNAILISPRNIEPTLLLDTYSALETKGVNTLSQYFKEHCADISEKIEFSPYTKDSFEPVLRQAATH